MQSTKIIRLPQSLALLTTLLTITGTPALAARDFTCSQRNDVCVVNDRNIVSGDELGFFTDRGELIATGKVTKMNGSKRSVQLQQVMGQVNSQADSYAMLDTRSDIRSTVSQQQYRIYKRPAQLTIGSSLGMTSFGAGGDAHGYELSGEAIRTRFVGQVDGYVRGSFYTLSGTSRKVYGDAAYGDFKSNALAISGGVAYTLFSRDDFVLRTEAGLGLAYTLAKINNSVGQAKSPEWGYEVPTGIAPYARGLLAAGYKFDAFQFELGVAPALLAGKSATTLGAGILMNLK
jgi:hypothetical protein